MIDARGNMGRKYRGVYTEHASSVVDAVER
jgi:hypothetical protein